MFTTSFRSIEYVFQPFIRLEGAATFYPVHEFNKKLFNSFLNLYIVILETIEELRWPENSLCLR